MTVDLRAAALAAGIRLRRAPEALSRRITSEGVDLHILDWGSLDGTAVLLLHGFGQTAHTWDLVSVALPEPYRVLALDLRGHGDSGWTPDGDYRLDDMVTDVVQVVERLVLGRLVLVGMSLGGLVAIRAAARLSDRLAGLVLVDVGLEPAPRAGRAIGEFLAREPLASIDAFVSRARAFNPDRPVELLRRSLEHSLRRTPDGMFTWKLDPRAQAMSVRGREDLESWWAAVVDIGAPALVVRGGRSRVLSPEGAAKLAAAFPRGDLVTIPDAGHSVQGDQPAALADVLVRFLSERVDVGGDRHRGETTEPADFGFGDTRML
ncbi:MAG: alpha/beta fold hydrolase [Candidatus Limnocylindrales bacterium]